MSKNKGIKGRKLNYLDLNELVAIRTPAVENSSKKRFGKCLSMNEIIYYINVNFKVGRQLVHKAGARLPEVTEVVVWCLILLQFTSLTYSKKDHKSQIAIG